ncbi:bidirectional sugar transporter SWEET14-like isoform X2 [Nymphaea colorata]|uniref:bidirectional sugar transporter SWEET14-like isoform X2 n=1 Tax=Nymphaea colorata TaxID=210225 RepID=UPI00129EB965|nr:bidirectional sugar transporter SWEET14-like isoform X2 [Nymphaea colorata]
MVVAHPLAFVFGLLGNAVSFMVYLAPAPTFYRIFKKKTTDGFQSVPYVVALFSAMLWIYYAILKANAILLISVNIVGCFIESAYIFMYILYAPKKAKAKTVRLLLLLNVGAFCSILVPSQLFASGGKRLRILGFVCSAFAVSVSAAPLSIMLPNVLGLTFGTTQMALYLYYKNKSPIVTDEKLPEQAVSVNLRGGSEVYPVNTKADEAEKLAEVRLEVERPETEAPPDLESIAAQPQLREVEVVTALHPIRELEVVTVPALRAVAVA